MGMHQGVRGAVVAVALFCSRVVVAQPEEPKAPEPAEATPATPPPSDATKHPATPPATPPAKDPGFAWEPFGYLRLQYMIVQNDPNVQFVGRDDGFELQNARVGVRGTYRDRMKFVVAFDGAVDERAQINTPEGKLRVGLRDAYLDTKLAGDIAARGGFFETLIDPDALEDATLRDFVDRPIETRGMRATEGYEVSGLPPGRSLGGAVRLEPGAVATGAKVGFEIAVQNGADEYASNNDNDKPAISAAVVARLPEHSWVVAGGRYNPRTVGNLPFRQDEDDLQGTVGGRIDVGPVIVGGGVFVQRTSFPTTGGPAQNAFGGHGQLLVKIPGTLPLAVGYRFGILDPSSLILTDRVMEHTAGMTLGVPAYRMRVQLQLTHVVEQSSRALTNDRAQLAAEVAL
jgi:hypothetical protein